MADSKKPGKKAPEDAEREALVKELRALIPRLDAEGLSFLIDQAQVHLYNMQVEELNATLARPKPGPTRKVSPRASGDFRIEGSESGSSYYVIHRGEWFMFSREEMIQITGIVSAPGTDLEIRERIFGWLEKERRDVLTAVPIQDKFDEGLKKLVALIRKTFKLRYA